MEIAFPNGRKLRFLVGDITKIPVDAMVNAANSGLRGGGGVDGAIHRAGGPAIMRELDVIRGAQGGCPTGGAVVTSAGALPASFIFHAVGPIYRNGHQGEPQQLESCYRTCLALADERAVATISFPAISTGVYGYPIGDAAAVALQSVATHLANTETTLREAIIVLFDQASYETYTRVAIRLRLGSR